MGSVCKVNQIKDLTFSMYNSQDIEKLSVLNLTSIESINSLGHYIKNGVYDLRMGPMPNEQSEICETCKQNSFRCLGHCGHIDLPLPVFNPYLVSALETLLQRICFNCLKFQVTDWHAVQFGFEVKLFDAGFVFEALNVAEMASQLEEHLGEAEEDSLISKMKAGKNKNNSAACSLELRSTLKKYCSQIGVKRGSSTFMNPTNNTQSIYLQLHSKFLKETFLSTSKAKCFNCGHSLVKLHFQNASLFIKNSGLLHSYEDFGFNASQQFLAPNQAMAVLRKCWEKYGRILTMIYPFLSSSSKSPTDVFFMLKLLVIPPRYRPCDKRNGMLIENELSSTYKNIIGISKCLHYLHSRNQNSSEPPESLVFLMSEVKGETLIEKVHSLWVQLQESINKIYDSELGSFSKNSTAKGIRQIIEKKFGLFRQNLMGKRVNYSARSVAAPDPMIGVDEVGVPQDFAMKLTFPVPVTSSNVAELRQLIINGPHTYPGVNAIEDERGFMQSLTYLSDVQRKGIASKLFTPLDFGIKKKNSSKIVYRHLENGDYVLMNRQPTLHKPSIQAHRARVMPNDRVLRMPYANCKAYNADFDGDELNLHFVQNQEARSEAKYLITTHNQYLTPKDGSPLAGLIQDSVVSAVMLTVRGKFFSREDYQQLVFISLGDKVGKIELLPPAIMKPVTLWSGKQIISTILHNLIPKHKVKPSFTFKATLKVDIWQTQHSRKWKGGGTPESKRESMTESEFIIKDGELLCGVIDKSAIGSAMYGLVHTCYDLYGGVLASQLLTSISRLCVIYLQWTGHTISIKEFLTNQKTSAKRRSALKKLIESTPQLVSDKLNISEDLSDHIEHLHMTERQKDMEAVDAAYTSTLGQTTSNIISENEKNLLSPNLENHMRMMVDTGAKGSKVNLNQMASLFGTVAIDGKRMSMSITGKTLPYFKPYDSDPQSGGYIPYRFVSGMELKSYFFLCIVGRDSLQHTAVKTSNSGYMQRCLIKHLEGIKVEYDMTVRNSDGVLIQFEYGEDGLDVTKIPFLKQPSSLDVVINNFSLLNDLKGGDSHLDDGLKAVQKHKKKIRKWKKERSTSAFLQFCQEISESEGPMNKKSLIKKWFQIDPDLRKKMVTKGSRCPDPVSSIFGKASQLGVVSEAMDNLIQDYFKNIYSKRAPNNQSLTKDEVSNLIYRKFQHSLIDPGEAVGAVCAQAIGEPLTQMTLNTFHFAGRDELNVTLGVPRMIELLRTATENISTPIMEIPFRPCVTPQTAEHFRQTLVPISFSKVLERVKVTSCLERRGSTLVREVVIRFAFLPSKDLKKAFSCKSYDVLESFEDKYIYKVFLLAIQKAMNKKTHFSNAKQIVQKIDETKATEGDEDQTENLNGKSDNEEDYLEESIMGISSGSRQNKSNEQDYDEEEEEKSILNQDDELFSDVEHSDADQEEVVDEMNDDLTSVSHTDRIANKILYHPWVVNYIYDKEKFRWCQIKLNLPVADGKYDVLVTLQQTLEKTSVNLISNIKKAFVVEKDESLVLRTEGVDIQKMLQFGHLLDLNSLYTNNVHTIAKMFGIEAAQRAIIKEIRAVQSAYDIKVDFRHLSLLSDYFTCEGVYKACSRQALSTCSSPIQKMSYETCFAFMKQAILQGLSDTMNSPSARIFVGEPIKLGSNSFDILTKLSL